MTAHKQMRNLLGLDLPRISRASRRRRKQARVARLLLEPLQERVMLSADIVGATGVAPTTAWLGALPGSIPLTDISMPGTVNSASGPSLQDALLGTGADNEVSPPTSTPQIVNDVDLGTWVTAATASEVAIAAGGENVALNNAATAANTAAAAADVATGITGASSGAGLATGLASDMTGLASAVASAVQTNLSSTNATADAAASDANGAVTAPDTAAGAAATTAGVADAAAGTADTAAGTTDTAAGTADTAAGTADTAAGTADTAAGASDIAAATADGVAVAQGGFDPAADGVAAGLDGTAAGLDTAAVTANTAADVANTAADVANGAATPANTAADTANTAADTANGSFSGTTAAAEGADTAASTADSSAAAAHTAAVAADGFSSASFLAAAASGALTAQQYGSFAAGMSSPSTTGNNPNNQKDQNTVYGLAVAAATAHSAAAVADTAAGIADGWAARLNLIAASANSAAVSAVAAATAANATAATADKAATTADAAATTADAAATAADEAATAADAAAEAADAAALTADATAGIDNGVTAGAEAAAAAADTTAIALDVTAAATAFIPFVDIGTAAAAAVADGVAATLDVAADVAAGTDITFDGIAAVADTAAAIADAAATAADATALAADTAAATADETATTADAAATTADEAATAADAAAVTACDTATAANDAADTADKAANTANNVATHLTSLATAADVAFLAGVTSIQTTQAALQTQTLSIADQLGAGIRSLDLRGALVNDTINLNAGQDFTGVTLQGALNDMTSFLQANPSETIVVSLSANEAASINSPKGFNADLNTLLNSADTVVPGTTYRDFIYSSSNPTATPTLGQVRGKIVIIPDQSWTPAADPATGLTIGWQPSQVVQDSHSVSDPNTRWNYAENDNGSNDNGLIPTDLGNPSTLYRNNLTQDGTSTETSATLAASVNAIAEQYFGKVAVSRTTGIVGMNNPGQNLVDEIINENNLPIVVTTNSDATGATGMTLRAAIAQANSQSGVSTITFADVLTGTTGNTIVLQSDLPVVTNDLVVAGPVFINTNGHQGLHAAATHNVTETNYVASASGVTPSAPATDSTPVYLVNGLLQVAPGPLVVDPVDITYGTALDNSQLTGIATDTNGASIPGTFTYTSDAGKVLNAGDGQSIAVTFTPTDTTLKPSAGTVIVNVARATPTISKLGTVNITYGTALDNSQLTGTASVPGTFLYARAAGTLLHAGDNQSESITFIPTDTADYTSVFSSVIVNVAQATPEVTVNPVSITYGTALDNSQLGGTATFTVGGKSVTVPGTFTYTSADGTLLYGGSNQSEAVTFTPGDTTDYTTISSGLNVIVNVSTHATPLVATNPASITYGTALDNSQLSGTAIFALPGKIAVVPGTFTYTSAAGTVPNAGDGQKEDVTFTPDDTTTYASVSSSVIVNVAQATPEVTVNPVGITYGTALDNSQLGGTATFTVGGKSVTVPGTFTYTSAAGSLLNAAASGQSEAVTFTPNDTTDYTTASGTVSVSVAQATPTVAVNPVTLIFGTALNDSQLSGTATFTVGGNSVAVPGTFTFTDTRADGTLLSIGNDQVEAVTFTPADATDYKAVSSSVTINVLPIPPKVTITDAGGIYTGLPFAATGTATGLNGVNIATPTNPTYSYYLASTYDPSHPDTAQRLAGAPSDVGNYIAVAAFQPTGNYGAGGAITSFSITPAATATAITTSVSPAVYGQQITYTAAVANTSGTAAAPAGAVQFVVDGVDAGLPVPLTAVGLNADGQSVSQAVSAPIDFPNGSSHSVQAVYVPSIPNPPVFPNPDFIPSSSAALNQAVQSIAVEGTALFIGSDGASSADQVMIDPIGSSNTGGTGVQLRTRLDGVNTVTNYSQAFSSVHIYEQNGNDNIRLGTNLILGAIVSAGNGNDTIFLGNGDNTVTVGTGNDVIRAGNGSNTITAGAAGSMGNDNIMLGNGDNDVVTLLGNGNDKVTVGDGNGDIVSITGDGNNNVTVGDGNGDSVTIVGNGNNTVQTGTGSGTVHIAGIGHNKVRLGSSGWNEV